MGGRPKAADVAAPLASSYMDLNQDVKSDSPVSTAIHKRLRAAKKKITRIAELEAKQAAGGTLTEEQVPVVASKACVLAVIEELEKLGTVLADAVKEEHALVMSKAQQAALAAVAAKEELAKKEAEEAVSKAKAEAEAAVQAAATSAAAVSDASVRDAITKLVHLCYFSTVR